MIFVRSEFDVAGVVANTEPQTTTPRSVGTPSRYVVEVNAGWAAKHGVEAGAKARFEHLPKIDKAPL
jgi:uncharacterized membrane protein (UPF0127 family)